MVSKYDMMVLGEYAKTIEDKDIQSKLNKCLTELQSIRELEIVEIAETAISFIYDEGMLEEYMSDRDIYLSDKQKEYFCVESEDEDEDEDEHMIYAQCSICGYGEQYKLDEEEMDNLVMYYSKGRQAGYLQDLFPKVPAWIRAGAIDQYSNGFCICPKCSGQ